jgi:hypothetical protein
MHTTRQFTLARVLENTALLPHPSRVDQERQTQENAVQTFVDKYSDLITGTLSCFDRVVFKGYLPLGWPEAMEKLLYRQGFLIKDFKDFVSHQAKRIRDHAEAFAKKQGRPFLWVGGGDKDAEACAIAQRDGITQGLICVLRARETCPSFKVAYGDGRPDLVNKRRPCLCLYFYFLDRQFGLMHVRLQTWFPLTVQICVNGHSWLACQLDKAGIGYRRIDNAFLSIDDPQQAQKLARKFIRLRWPRILEAFARKVNPLLKDVLCGRTHYWVTDQAEFATDIMFRNRTSLRPVYEILLRWAALCFSAEDVMTFLGRKLHGNFQGEVVTEYRDRWPGARVKHRVKKNWLKMYDKFGSILRVEMVINAPREFRIRREGKRNGQPVVDWFPMAKRISNLYRYAEVSLQANRNYLAALAEVDTSSMQAAAKMRRAATPIRQRGRSYRGFNPASTEDVRLFAAVLRGEHAIHGFRNENVRRHLFGEAIRPKVRRRHAARVSRLLKRLHAHGLIAKIPRSRRWRITVRGRTLMIATCKFHHEEFPDLVYAQAL